MSLQISTRFHASYKIGTNVPQGRSPTSLRSFVPILYRQAGRGGFLGVSVIVFCLTYRDSTTMERTIPSLATTFFLNLAHSDDPSR